MSVKLNKNQEKAVYHTDGPLRIIAGPGSGKTKIIVSKIIHILSTGLAKPDEILAISFTNKATSEIRQRVMIENGSSLKNIFTYHGWCNYFLRVEADAAGLNRDFIIIDASDSSSRINNLIKENNYSIDKSDAIIAFEKISREELKVSELEYSDISSHVEISKLWEKYRNDKRVNGQLDFNDLISEVKNLLCSNDEISKKWKSKYKYIFIDEFQDTNNIQFEIIKRITNDNSNITVVGDPDQNIYSWRGANIDLINNFNNWFPSAKTIFLDINYRSTPEIINASNSLIKNNKNRVGSFLSSPFKDHASLVEIIEKENDIEEAWALIRKIKLLNKGGYKYHDMAIIVRSSFKTRPIEASLNHFNIPYKVIGAMKFFDRKEVKQTMKFLLFVAKQNDANLLDIINDPPKKFGPKKIAKLKAESEDEGLTMWEFIKKFPLKIPDSISEWSIYTQQMINSILKGDEPSIVLESYLEDIEYFLRIFNEPSRKENIKELLKIIKIYFFENKSLTVKEKITEFTNNSILSSSSDKYVEEGEVNIITAHASKGTEFPVVFLYSVVEGHWPSTKAIETGQIEEERRVVYVAMTRAMDKLIITVSNGWNNYNKQFEQSRFINELLTQKTYNYIETNIIRPRAPDVEFEISNINTSIVNSKIFHSTFGEGIIIKNDGLFISVNFESNKTQEIMLGHKSYKVIK